MAKKTRVLIEGIPQEVGENEYPKKRWCVALQEDDKSIEKLAILEKRSEAREWRHEFCWALFSADFSEADALKHANSCVTPLWHRGDGALAEVPGEKAKLADVLGVDVEEIKFERTPSGHTPEEINDMFDKQDRELEEEDARLVREAMSVETPPSAEDIIDAHEQDRLAELAKVTPQMVEVAKAVSPTSLVAPMFEDVDGFHVEYATEDDGRWIADIASVPGAMAYGATREHARENALKIARNASQERAS